MVLKKVVKQNGSCKGLFFSIKALKKITNLYIREHTTKEIRKRSMVVLVLCGYDTHNRQIKLDEALYFVCNIKPTNTNK